MADLNRPDYGQVWASTGEKVAPDTVKMQSGWVQEMMPYQYENYLQARQDEAILYLLQKGIPEYSTTQEYTANKSVVLYNGAVYLATQTVTGVLPTVAASWKRVSTISDNAGIVSVAGGGTGATTQSQARTNLGLGTAATLDADSVVQRDPNGDFTANTITASLAGNASTADKWKTARTVQLTGGATSTAASVDGSSNVTVSVSSLDATYLAGAVPANSLVNAVVKTSSTGAAKLPKGTTAQRPASPEFGDFRANETTGLVEYWNGTAWVNPQAYSSEYVLNRTNHTGTQHASTITGLSVGASFTTVPTTNQGPSIVVTAPHLRFMVWDGAKYVRAPWHQPCQLFFSYDNPASIPGALPVRGDVTWQQADFPDVVTRLGLSGTGTFTLAEARGEGIRVLDNGRGVDVGRVLRSAQGDAIRNITGNLGYAMYPSGVTPSGTSAVDGSYQSSNSWSAGSSNSYLTTLNASRQVPTANEVRMRNIAFPLWMTI